MIVYVIMGNDYPDAVFNNKEAAEAYCARKKQERKDSLLDRRPIYWRSYSFVVQS